MFHSQTLGIAACPATHPQEHDTAITARRHSIPVPHEKGSHAGVVPAETHTQIHQPSLCASPCITGVMQQLFLDSFLVLSTSLQLDTMLCDLSWGSTNKMAPMTFHIALSWEIHDVIEVPNRSTGEGFLTGAWATQRQAHHCKTYPSVDGDSQEWHP